MYIPRGQDNRNRYPELGVKPFDAGTHSYQAQQYHKSLELLREQSEAGFEVPMETLLLLAGRMAITSLQEVRRLQGADPDELLGTSAYGVTTLLRRAGMPFSEAWEELIDSCDYLVYQVENPGPYGSDYGVMKVDQVDIYKFCDIACEVYDFCHACIMSTGYAKPEQSPPRGLDGEEN